ncbi:hypothetical protein D3C73_1360490 [compost metagenome]
MRIVFLAVHPQEDILSSLWPKLLEVFPARLIEVYQQRSRLLRRFFHRSHIFREALVQHISREVTSVHRRNQYRDGASLQGAVDIIFQIHLELFRCKITFRTRRSGIIMGPLHEQIIPFMKVQQELVEIAAYQEGLAA